MRASLLADGEALGQKCLCAGPETLERGEERQGPTSPRAGLLYVFLHLPRGGARTAAGLCWGWGGSVPGVGKAQDFFSYSFARDCTRTEKLQVKEISGHTSALPSIPSLSHSYPMST